MSHIYLYSPSGAVRDKDGFKRAVARLRALGHDVEIDPDALKSQQRFAGDDATRVAAVARAAASGADVAMPTRGGYGLTRILPALPYKAMAQSMDRGMLWVGHSDFTALQMAVLARTQRVTWAGPHAIADFGAPEVDDIMQACFEDLTSGQGEGSGWRLSSRTVTALEGRPSTLARNATLWGGNLAVLASLVGTPYLPDVRKGILFLEDVSEHPYRVERMLSQLLHAGVLARQQALVLGQFTDYRLTDHDKGFQMNSVVDWLRSQLRIPVLTDMPFGHVATKVCLPVGAQVNLVHEGREALLLWGAIGH